MLKLFSLVGALALLIVAALALDQSEAEAQTGVVPDFFVQIASSSFHTCGLRENGEIECWGRNGDGLADAPAGAFSAVSAGWLHACGLRENGEIECWGRNGYGQADAPAGAFSAVSAGDEHTCGLRENGEIECWGWNRYGQADAPAGAFSAVSAGDEHTCGLRTSGAIKCWGSRWRTDAPAGAFSAVSAGAEHTCGLRASGAVECWGLGLFQSGQTDAPGGTFSAVSAGWLHTCGLRASGAVECWGLNQSGQTDAPGGTFSAVSAGSHHTCGLRSSGAVKCWGADRYYLRNVPGGAGFAYELSDQTWQRNMPIAPLQFPASGCTGDVTYEVITQQTPGDRNSFVWRPPDGLTFDETTKLLSGAPTSPPGRQHLFYRARGAGNRDCGQFGITVTIVEGLEFARAIQPQKWTLGETVTLDLPRAAGGREPLRYELQSEPSALQIETPEPNWLLVSTTALRGLVFKTQEHQLHGRVVAPPGVYDLELSATDTAGITGSTSFRVEIEFVDRQQMVEDPAAQRIARIYAPVLLRDRDENFKPVSIDAMLDHAALYQENPDDKDQSRLIQLQGTTTEADLFLHDGQDVYLDLFASVPGTNEEEWEKVEEHYPATVYARVFTHDRQLVIQYWFFYVYNNGPGGGIGVPFGIYDDHEGDWEGIQLVFSEAGTSRLLDAEGRLARPPLPVWLGYASHNHGELRLVSETRWRNPHGTLTAPVVYVAEGSHASYAYRVVSRSGTRAADKDFDIARGNHPDPLVEGSDYQLQLIRGDEQWLSWTGRWGKDHIHGPKVQGRRWTEPICWPGWRTNDQNEAAFAALRDC